MLEAVSRGKDVPMINITGCLKEERVPSFSPPALSQAPPHYASDWLVLAAFVGHDWLALV